MYVLSQASTWASESILKTFKKVIDVQGPPKKPEIQYYMIYGFYSGRYSSYFCDVRLCLIYWKNGLKRYIHNLNITYVF